RDPVIPTRMACSDTQLIARTEIEAKRLATGSAMARARKMPDECSRDVSNATSGASQTSREIEIFGIREQRGVEDVSGGGQRVEAHEQRTSGGELDVACIEAAVHFDDMCWAPSPRRIPRTAEPELVGRVAHEDSRIHQRDRRIAFGCGDEGLDALRIDG